MIICLETATNLCSVALCDNAGVISLRESNDSRSHASMLTVFIDEIFRENGINARDLKAIAVSKGPGSYTGLRIGVSAAKGIAYAASIPLIAVDTTYVMYTGMAQKMYGTREPEKDILFCPMLDARRMEVYYAIYDGSGNIIKNIAAEVVNEDSFSTLPVSDKIVFFGDGASKCMEIIKRPNVSFDTDFRISASFMCKPANKALISSQFENVAYFEPFYLKDFITTKQRKNILGNL